MPHRVRHDDLKALTKKAEMVNLVFGNAMLLMRGSTAMLYYINKAGKQVLAGWCSPTNDFEKAITLLRKDFPIPTGPPLRWTE